ncbi:hypothetical protein KY284_002210 [Solanum tuberosum]|nr:hypothetical protein KY284_002210 [Solanum tuberosum]
MIAICTELRKVNILAGFMIFAAYKPSVMLKKLLIFHCLNYSVFPSSLTFLDETSVGCTVVEGSDYCIITPPEKLNVTEIDTYDDHRMAMLSLLLLVLMFQSPLRTPVVLAKPSPTTLRFSRSTPSTKPLHM